MYLLLFYFQLLKIKNVHNKIKEKIYCTKIKLFLALDVLIIVDMSFNPVRV